MQTVSDNETVVTLQLTLAELAMVNDALSYRGAIAASPRYTSDRLNEADAQMCNELEKQTFALYVTYSEQARLAEQERDEYEKRDEPVD